MQVLMLLLIGAIAGMASGILGIGGATLMIPALIYLFGFSQHQAQGTTLACMVLPIGLLAAWKYYQAGNVHIVFALCIAAGFVVGGLIGARIAMPLPDMLLRRIFGIFLLGISISLIFFRK